ncbi:MAG: phosphoglycerate kinase [Rickettsiales bacterium]|nr:phosphoglycerate kinase [Rickettsiales bacterium]|tara:strand:+ start:271 stop:678 length:408 start_codon:yes stop_codon:yes gene_type:complete
MGLDQYAYRRLPEETSEENIELAYWRKHNRLQGWMEQLWIDKGRPNANEQEGCFNCVELEITLSDLDELETQVENKALPETHGFFFGNDSFSWEDEEGEQFEDGDYYYKETDLDFIRDAREAISEGQKVYYNCWW